MRPALAAVAEQQITIEAQHKQITNLERAVFAVAKLAGLEDAPVITDLVQGREAILAEAQRKVAALRATADAENPAQPIPEPGAEAPAATTAETLGDLNDADVEAVGATNVTDVSPDATTTVDSTQTVLDEPLDLNEQDPTKPVAGTQEMRPLDEVKIETEVVAKPGDNTSTMFPLQGPFAEQPKTSASEGRTWASLRLARLRIQAGVETGDDLLIGEAISTSAATDEAIQNEIDTLAKVVQAARVRPADDDTRRLVPRAASAQRTTPSFASDLPTAEQMSVMAGRVQADEVLFEG